MPGLDRSTEALFLPFTVRAPHMSADPPAHVPVLDNSHQHRIACSFRERPASALEVGSIPFGQGILGPECPEHSLERVSDGQFGWGHQVRLRMVPWLSLLNRRGVAREAQNTTL